MNKFFTAIFLLFLSHISYAQNSSIFKCTDSQGNISYVNNPNKSFTCSKTDLADLNTASTISSSIGSDRSKVIKNNSNNNFINSSPSIFKDDEQQLRETKRQLVLKKELNDEQEQLDTINSMLKKTDTQDINQTAKLKEMQETHNRNILALNKELGINKTTMNQPVQPLLTVVNTKSNIDNKTNNKIITENKIETPTLKPVSKTTINKPITTIKKENIAILPIKKIETKDTNAETVSLANNSIKKPYKEIDPTQFLLGK